jgi:hypothetical protein
MQLRGSVSKLSRALDTYGAAGFSQGPPLRWLSVALATFKAACKRWPKAAITLGQEGNRSRRSNRGPGPACCGTEHRP